MTKIIGVLTLFIYFSIFFVLVININKKNKLIKNSFIAILMLLVVLLSILSDTIMDNILESMVYFWYYPSFSLYLFLLVIALLFFIYNIYNEKLGMKYRIINFIFSSLIIVSYIIFMLLNVDTYSYSELYNGTSLICLRYMTRTFFLWGIFNLLYLLYLKYYKEDHNEC